MLNMIIIQLYTFHCHNLTIFKPFISPSATYLLRLQAIYYFVWEFNLFDIMKEDNHTHEYTSNSFILFTLLCALGVNLGDVH